MLSASCSGRFAPIRTLVTAGWCSSHASATCATVTPRASATPRSASSTPGSRSRSTGGKSKFARRPSAAAPSPSYLPDSSPPASGLHTISPTPSDCQHRHDLALQVAPDHGVVGLQRGDPRQPAPLGDPLRLGHPPRRPVRHADVAHQALAHQLVQRLHGLLDRRGPVGAVDLVEVDMVELQPPQARLRPRRAGARARRRGRSAPARCARRPWWRSPPPRARSRGSSAPGR